MAITYAKANKGYMQVIIRVDSSFDIGAGHLMRCLTLANFLRKRKAQVSFISRALPGNLCGLILKNKYQLYQLPYKRAAVRIKKDSGKYLEWLGVLWETDAVQTIKLILKQKRPDLLVVDHYALDSFWEKRIRPYVNKIMVIDDLANRKHICDILLDQNYYSNMELRYEGLVPKYSQKFFGPKYTLLREEFLAAKKALKRQSNKIKRIFVSFGGVDATNETCKVLEAIKLLNRSDIHVDVIIGFANPHKDKIIHACNNLPNIKRYLSVGNISRLMAKADLAIGAGGITVWERCFLGLPAIVIAVAQNQVAIAQNAALAGALLYLGYSDSVHKHTLSNKIDYLLNHPEQMRQMRQIGMRFFTKWEYHNHLLLERLLHT